MMRDLNLREHSRVFTIGHLDHLEYPQLFAAADAFVLASHGEGWGRPIVEGKIPS